MIDMDQPTQRGHIMPTTDHPAIIEDDVAARMRELGRRQKRAIALDALMALGCDYVTAAHCVGRAVSNADTHRDD